MFNFQLRGKHCWHPIAIMGVVDTFGQELTTLAYKTYLCGRCYIQNLLTYHECELIFGVPCYLTRPVHTSMFFDL